nr:ATP synthase F0 subunit 8 [Isocladus armatus]
MPQMAPMAWGPLYIFFLSVLFVYFSLVYYSPRTESSALLKTEARMEGLNWRW